ncbi:phosphatidate cytidylyltransferase [Rhodoglobus aureus]|jgi:phosphatidate cytidylyltransferase|uniref:Phosphatidate cytidylyltransferase n=1 Tax=Rhodoglobus aureus TaxID=191497 RepID=A0ABP4G9V6_9MICO
MVSEFEAQVRATNDKINARTGRPLAMALTVGLALGLSLLFSLIFVKELYMLFAGVLVAFTAFELASALRFAGLNIPRLPTVIAAVAVVPASFYWLAEGQWYITLAGIAFVSVWRLVWLVRPNHRSSVRAVLRDLGAGVFVMLYIAFLASFTVLLTAQDGGQWWTLAMLIVVVVSDIGAYASGLSFGKHPMAPTISPNKTWEGFAGAAVASVAAGVLLALFMIDQPVWVGIIFGLVILGTATMGDLAESLIKRDLGIKDISTWLPGHGGFLDRVDSSLLSAAAGYALFLIFA